MSTANPTESHQATASKGELASGDPGAQGTAADLTTFLEALLEFQSRLVDAIGGVAFFVESAARRGGVAALFVADAPDAEALRAALAPEGKVRAAMERAGQEVAARGDQRGDIVPVRLGDAGLYDASPTHRLLACPIIAAGQTEGAFVLVQSINSKISADDALSRLALTGARLESFLWQQRAMSETEQRVRLRETLELLDASQQGANAEAMGALMCHELQRRFGCSRVSIGLIRGEQIRMAALSGADSIDRRGAAVEAIEAAMDECADQDIEVIFPSPDETEHDPAQRRVTRAHGKLSEQFGPSSVLSLPLRVEGDLVGVVVLERPADDPFPPGSATLLRLVAEFIGPALWTRRMADRGVLAVTRDRSFDLCRAIVGPRHTGKKLLGMAAAIAIVIGSVPWMPMRISASAEIKAAESRTIVPPFDGHLAEVFVRPGDAVSEGQELASLDTTELVHERDRIGFQQTKAMTERDEATRNGNQAQAAVYAGEIAELGQRLDVIQYRLENAQIRAPFTGVIGQGDLEALVGAQVDPSKPLFMLVGSENIAAVEIDERDIGDIREDQEGFLVLKGRPGERMRIRVSHISPVAEPIERANVYKIEAEFVDLPDGIVMSPGMSASVKLNVRRDGEVVRRSPLDAMLGPIIDNLRMRLWF